MEINLTIHYKRSGGGIVSLYPANVIISGIIIITHSQTGKNTSPLIAAFIGESTISGSANFVDQFFYDLP